MAGWITIYDNESEPYRAPIVITKEAVHEEELMKSDFVRLSWVADERYEIPAGAYIQPFENVRDIAGRVAQFTLYKTYQPERTAGGYRYQPEFQHPKMWLGFQPYYFTTEDASGTVVHKTKYNYVGSIETILAHICNFINRLYGLEEPPMPFVGQYSPASGVTSLPFLVNITSLYRNVDDDEAIEIIPSVDITQTVSWTFDDTDVLSAIADLAKVCETEWHIDWDARLIHFGYISLNVTEFELVSEYVDDSGAAHVGNVGVPSVTSSKDKQYNSFLVHGSSRNNTRETENGNTIAVDAPLLLSWEYDAQGNVKFRGLEDESHNEKYPGSIIDMRGKDEDGNRVGPQLTQILNIDSIYPHYELYLYDLVERHKYKKNERGEITSEKWSVWYTRLARKTGNSYADFLLLENEARVKVLTKYSDTGNFYIVFDMYYVRAYYKDTNPYASPTPTANVTWLYGGETIAQQLFVGTSTYATGHMTMRVTLQQFNGISAGDELVFSDGFRVDVLPSEMIVTRLIDGLVPTLAMQINDTPNSQQVSVNSLGTREFELIPVTRDIDFNNSDDELSHRVSVELTVQEKTDGKIRFKLENKDEYFVSRAMGVCLLYNSIEYNITRFASMRVGETSQVEYLAFYVEDLPSDTIGAGHTLSFTWGFNTKAFPSTDFGGRILPVPRGYWGDGVTAGYYEIKYVEEGSDKLIIPTTTEQGIIPREVTSDITSADIGKNSKATIFNIAMSDDVKREAQAELEEEALNEIAAMELDTNNYTFKSNVVLFEKNRPNLTIGRRVSFRTGGLMLHTRILKLTTKLDYDFDQEITVGNQPITGKYSMLKNELWALQNDFTNWKAGGVGSTEYSELPVTLEVDRGHWDDTAKYYFETFNRDTGCIETSIVTNYGGARWRCKRSLTTQEPVPGCSDWEMIKAPEIWYTPDGELEEWDEGTMYYFETLHFEADGSTILIDRIETSRCTLYGLTWKCCATGTQERPHYGAHDWVVDGESVLEVLIRNMSIVNALGYYEQLDADLADGEILPVGIRVYHGTEDVSGFTFDLIRDDSKAGFSAAFSDRNSIVPIPARAIFGGMVTIDGVEYDMRRGVAPMYEVAPKGSVTVTIHGDTDVEVRNARLDVVRVLPSIEYSDWEAGGTYSHTTRLISQVTHLNCEWQCLVDGTDGEPGFSPDWQLISGNNNLSIEFVSSRGLSFRRGAVNTTVTPYLYFGNFDISDRIDAEFYSWTRHEEVNDDKQGDAKYTVQDRTWNAQHQGIKAIPLTNNDMPAAWSVHNKTIFTLTVVVNDGTDNVIVQNQIVS